MLCEIISSPKQILITKSNDFPVFNDNFLTGRFDIYADFIFKD